VPVIWDHQPHRADRPGLPAPLPVPPRAEVPPPGAREAWCGGAGGCRCPRFAGSLPTQGRRRRSAHRGEFASWAGRAPATIAG
jgi:hypothetical protein